MRDLDRIIGTNVVLIYSLQPSDIIMRVRYQVNVNFPGNDPLGSIVSNILGFCKQNAACEAEEKDNQSDRHDS